MLMIYPSTGREQPPTYAEEVHADNPENISLNPEVLSYWRDIAHQEGAQALMDTPLLAHISGASGGAGKLTAVNAVREYWGHNIPVRFPKTATTRTFRDESDFDQYVLLRGTGEETVDQATAEARFESLVESGQVVESNNFNGNWYGKQLSDTDVRSRGITLIETDINGLISLKE